MVRETRLERAEMSGPLRFTDLGMLIGDHAFRRVACNVLDALAADTPAELERLADAEVREARFDAFWNRWVEPDGEESLNSNVGDPAVLAYNMAHQGIVIDHILHLLGSGKHWRELVEGLVRGPKPTAKVS